MARKEVFCWGSLGPGPREEIPSPVEACRQGSEPDRVYAGSGRALLTSAKGARWLSGQDCPTDDTWVLTGIKGAAFGQTHTLLLRKSATGGNSTDDAGSETEVLAWGSGEQGQLGLGAGTIERKVPQAIPALSAYHVVQVACGALHSAAVTSYGDLFTWGRGIEGQLGHASRHLPPDLNEAITGIQLRPKPVPAFMATKKRHRPVAGVSCGVNFTVVVTRAGEIWAFGGGIVGQLGIGRLTNAKFPTVVMTSCPATGEPFVEVAAGWAHTLARTSGGRIFSWGFNALGALGLGDHRTRWLPESVRLDGWQHEADDKGGGDGVARGEFVSSNRTGKTIDVAAVKLRACGNCSGALSTEGELFTWGCGRDGILGHKGGGQSRPSRPEGVDHVLRPRRVERLDGAKVTDFALSTKGGVALVPLCVQSIEPVSGPLEAGCKVVIKGYGFWDSPDIVVKFTPVSMGHKPSAPRSAVGKYSPREPGQGGIEILTCAAPCFASPEAAYVEVSLDGTSFTTNSTRFQYYRTPELTRITPDTCRPPFPRLRLDGEHLTRNDTLLVRFEEEEEGSTDGDNGGVEESASLFEGTNKSLAPAPPRSARRVFVVHGRVESEVIEVGIDADTEVPIHEERRFITCDSPTLRPNPRLPFVSRVSIAPNGANFNGNPLRFIAHDPHADVCLPPAVPVPVPPFPASAADGDGDEGSYGVETGGPRIRITGRNLYRGTNVVVRLRFGVEDDSVVPFHTVSFDPASESIVGLVPMEAGALVSGVEATAPKETQRPPAIAVAVEVSMDGLEYFSVPERLTLYRGPHLTLHGDGFFPAADGGWAELKTAERSFRGNQAKIRLVSSAHGIDTTLPLLSSRRPEKIEERAEGASGEQVAEDAPSPEMLPSAGERQNESTLAQESARDTAVQGVEQALGRVGSTDSSKMSIWKETEVPASGESFFFAVPSLPKLTQGDVASCNGRQCGDGHGQDAAAAAEAAIPGDERVSRKALPTPASLNSAGGVGEDNAAPAVQEKTNIALTLLASLNGNDWHSVSGPPLTYFEPPPEPIAEPQDEPKKGKSKKK